MPAGAEKLQEKIRSEARRQAETIVNDARREAEAIVRQAREEAQAARGEAAAKADKDAAAREARLISVAELEGRKERLAEKQRLIDELFTQSINRLCALPDAEYEKLLIDMIAASASGGEEVILSKKDAARLSKNFINEASKAVAAKSASSPKPAALTLSAENRPIEGGFVLRSGDFEINNSFASIVKIQKDSLEALAVKMLFG
ncbi:MAG: V-type ATP synthase subunit E [Clostridiales bacterium]|jgi:V/A-type H+-transporting ATPase subunit E|nr:V-type ATP synthase subunit E [Clostridiales bacterium]